MDELRTENKECFIEIEELRSKLKVKKTKMKYINKQVVELTQQKEVSHSNLLTNLIYFLIRTSTFKVSSNVFL